MHQLFFHFLLLQVSLSLIFPACFSQKSFPVTSSTPPDHSIWTELLQKHVSEEGQVNYRGFIKDSLRLNEYLNLLSSHAPDKKKWSDEEQLAYWINVYNAFTVKIVTDHYPVESIKEIGGRVNIPLVSTVWDVKFIDIGGKEIDLNTVEHGIIRKEFDEPRIHFAVNCASYSCPILLNEAYLPEKLEEQLERQTIRFINDERFNIIKSPEEASLSKLFQWYRGDFRKDGKSVIDYVNQYSEIRLNADARISYLDYDWNLNE
jgi:hypothetical protein